MIKTADVKQLLKEKYLRGDFRILGNGTKTVELQGIQFEADLDGIIRQPNYDYAMRELKWYKSMSLNVNDIPGETPAIWKSCADKDGFINSNYGWCIWSEENGSQFDKCVERLVADNATREAVMIYNRPSMQTEAFENGRHDFMCTYAVQVFLNNGVLDYHVYMRSNDAVFGYCNDFVWHNAVMNRLVDVLNEKIGNVKKGKMIWNAGSLHVYERHFKYLE